MFQGRLRWLLIGWMFVMSAVAYLDRVNISVAGGAIADEYSLTKVQLGYVFSAFVLGYALFQAPGGRLADRFGPRLVVTAGVIWWGVFTSLSASVPHIGSALLLLVSVRFILGTGEAVVYPASNRLVANWIPSQERGIANGIIFAGVGVGAGVTPSLITYVMINYGWRWSFFVSAIVGTLAGVVWYLITRDRPRDHPWITRQECDYIERGLPEPPKELETGRTVAWGTILTSKDVLAMTLSYFAYGYAAYIFFTWFFLYLSKVRGLDLKTSAFYGSLPALCMALGSPLGGFIADRITAKYGKRAGRCGIAVFGLAFAAIFLGLGTQVSSAQLASIVLAGGAGALYLSQSSFWAVSADIAGPGAGSVSGIMNMGGQLGGTLTATLTPWIAENYGWTASFLTAAALCALGAVLWLFVDPTQELAHSDKSDQAILRSTS